MGETGDMTQVEVRELATTLAAVALDQVNEGANPPRGRTTERIVRGTPPHWLPRIPSRGLGRVRCRPDGGTEVETIGRSQAMQCWYDYKQGYQAGEEACGVKRSRSREVYDRVTENLMMEQIPELPEMRTEMGSPWNPTQFVECFAREEAMFEDGNFHVVSGGIPVIEKRILAYMDEMVIEVKTTVNWNLKENGPAVPRDEVNAEHEPPSETVQESDSIPESELQDVWLWRPDEVLQTEEGEVIGGHPAETGAWEELLWNTEKGEVAGETTYQPLGIWTQYNQPPSSDKAWRAVGMQKNGATEANARQVERANARVWPAADRKRQKSQRIRKISMTVVDHIPTPPCWQRLRCERSDWDDIKQLNDPWDDEKSSGVLIVRRQLE